MSAQAETPLFGKVERRLFRATAVLFSIVAMVGLIAGMVWILGLTLMFFYSLVLPLCVAGILALVLNPVVGYIETRMRVNRVVATSMILGLLNIVPFLGTLIGLLIVLPLAYFQPLGGFQLLGLSILVFTVVQLVESWLLTPKIMANRSGLQPALVVISVFFWGTALGGITGMILAVPLTAFLVAVWTQAKATLTQSMTSEHDAARVEILTGTAQPSTSRDNVDTHR